MSGYLFVFRAIILVQPQTEKCAMQKYNMIQAFFMSFYSRNLYRDVAKNWGGKVFLYLLVLIFLISIPTTIVAQHGIKEWYQQLTTTFSSQIPILKIDKGMISTPENRPYFIKDPDNKTIAVIDTSGQYTTLEQAQVGLLLTKTELIMQQNPDEIRIHKVPADLTMIVDPSAINAFFANMLNYAWIFIFITILFFGYLWSLIKALIYGLLGLIFANMDKVALKYANILQIAIVAMTPSIVINLILKAISVELPALKLLSFILTIFYLWYGIAANKEPKQ